MIKADGWAALVIGIDKGDRPCSQKTSIELSNVWDPLPEFVEMAGRSFTRRLPFAFDVDSEGPESRVSIALGPEDGQALFAAHDLYYPVIHYAAVVAAKQFGLALGRCLRAALMAPPREQEWADWFDLAGQRTGSHEECFGSSWLRDLSDETSST